MGWIRLGEVEQLKRVEDMAETAAGTTLEGLMEMIDERRLIVHLETMSFTCGLFCISESFV